MKRILVLTLTLCSFASVIPLVPGSKITPQHQTTTEDKHGSWNFGGERNDHMRYLGGVNDHIPFGATSAAINEKRTGEGLIPPFFFEPEDNSLTRDNRITNVVSTAASASVDALAMRQIPGNFSWKKELPSLIKTTNKVLSLIVLRSVGVFKDGVSLPRLTSALAALSTPVAQSFLLFKMRKQQKQYATEIEAYNQHLKDNPDEAKQWNKYKRGLYTSLAARTLINSKSAIFNKRVIDEDETDPLTKDEVFAYFGGSVIEPLLNTAEIIGRWIFYKKYIAAARQWYAEQYVE